MLVRKKLQIASRKRHIQAADLRVDAAQHNTLPYTPVTSPSTEE